LWSSFREKKMDKIAFSGKTVVPISSSPTDYERNISQLETAEFITANCGISKMALIDTGGFDERFTMAWREDSDLQFKLLEKNIPILKAQNAIVIHPVRKAPWGVSLREEKKGIFNALLYKKFPQLYKQKIQPRPPWHYYVATNFALAAIAGLFLKGGFITNVGITGWVGTTVWFTSKRLSKTSHSFDHIFEMFCTSSIIPILSLYYRIYGSIKYRVLLLP
jgi:hypothetical protein